MDILLTGAQAMGITLSRWQLSQFERYYEALIRWNENTNLTRITGYEDVQVKHFLDSLSLVPVMGGAASLGRKRVIDVGTGAGFPGLPVKILAPDIRLTLLEATNKKAAFLRDVIGTLGLRNVEVISGRAEEIGHDPVYRERYDYVLSRAVAPLAVLAELTLPLCRAGGFCIAPKKGDIDKEIKLAEKAIITLGGRLASVRPVNLEGEKDNRCLVILEKVAASPGEYPRRPGIPAKRPLS